MAQMLKNRLVNLRNLRVFLTVYDKGSVTQAAQVLHTSQPTVSIQLRQLTEIIDMPLYVMHGKKIIFTETGHLVARFARQILVNIDHLEIALSDIRQLKAGTLKIAVVTSCEYFVPHLIGHFIERYPLVDVDLKVGNRDKIYARYQQGLDDLYLFSHVAPDMTQHMFPLFTNRLFAIAGKSHVLAKKARIQLTSLFGYAWILREQGSGTRQAINAHFQQHQSELKPKLVIESNEAIKHCVLAGMGLTILSEYVLPPESDSQFAILPVETFPIETSWYIVIPPVNQQSLLSQAFVEYLIEYKETLRTEIMTGQYTQAT